MSQHIAFKCTYNNGGEGAFVGFNGTCSKDIIRMNIDGGRVWCSNEDCDCREYYDKDFRGPSPKDPCMESTLFRKWKFGAGTYHHGDRAGTAIHLSNAETGKIVVLTTLFPGDREIDRRIIGFFKIGRIADNNYSQTELYADKIYRIRLPLEEAKELYFWDYYATQRGAFWGSLLFRYLSDQQVVNILYDLSETLRDEKSKRLVHDLLQTDFGTISPSRPSGPRIRTSGNRTKRMSLSRKYGPGGEGEEHKKLKNWILENPDEIGLRNVIQAEAEHVFLSGDRADILFTLGRRRFAVVEIETVDALTGSYQAVKYKALQCAELRKELNSPAVEAIIVAWSIPPEVKKLCSQYGIRFIEKKI